VNPAHEPDDTARPVLGPLISVLGRRGPWSNGRSATQFSSEELLGLAFGSVGERKPTTFIRRDKGSPVVHIQGATTST